MVVVRVGEAELLAKSFRTTWRERRREGEGEGELEGEREEEEERGGEKGDKHEHRISDLTRETNSIVTLANSPTPLPAISW